jgi:hypothetical protein
MRGRADLSAEAFDANRPSPIDPSSVGFADTFSRKGRRKIGGKSLNWKTSFL